MRPVDMQPAVVQAPNVERIQQNLQGQPQVTQQTFAGQMQRIAAERPSQVQPGEPGQESQPAKVGEDKGEKRQRRMKGRNKDEVTATAIAIAKTGEGKGESDGEERGTRLDVKV